MTSSSTLRMSAAARIMCSRSDRSTNFQALFLRQKPYERCALAHARGVLVGGHQNVSDFRPRSFEGLQPLSVCGIHPTPAPSPTLDVLPGHFEQGRIGVDLLRYGDMQPLPNIVEPVVRVAPRWAYGCPVVHGFHHTASQLCRGTGTFTGRVSVSASVAWAVQSVGGTMPAHLVPPWLEKKLACR